MPVEVMRGFEEAFGCKILEGYGLSETSPIASFNHPDRERKPGSIGTPIAGTEMKVVDDDGNEVAQGEIGEILIKGHNVMKGYWERPEATAESIKDGWFATGDMAKVDEDGYFYIVDRKKDLIIRGGYNVYPRDIEEVLYEHPAVREAAVVGIPHDELGEEVGAAVALKDGRVRRRGDAAARSSRSRSRRTSTRAGSGSSTSCRRARPARSSSARSIDRREPVAEASALVREVRPHHRRHGVGGHGRGASSRRSSASRSRRSRGIASAATACGPAACRPRRCSPRRRRRTRCATPMPTA